MTAPSPAHRTVIGLEVHVRLATKTKLFCACPYTFGRPPNTLTCPVCAGHPGTLPVLNRAAFRLGLLATLLLDCTLPRVTRFDRKHYFYPDLPKGYQITQYAHPLGRDGRLTFLLPEGTERTVKVERVHLEEDAGKTLHPPGADFSLVDLNRAGTPLVEIVTAPEIRSPLEARLFLEALRRELRYAGVSKCDMEKGALRCDANLSLQRADHAPAGGKVEIKNLNSFRHVEQALRFEEIRQARILARGGRPRSETRTWLEAEGRTRTLRTKEEARDYRYFPDPDLPPLEITPDLTAGLRKGLPERPLARMKRFRETYGLGWEAAEELTRDKAWADYFEAALRAGAEPREASNWIRTRLLREGRRGVPGTGATPVPPESLARLLRLVAEGSLSRPAARTVLEAMMEGGEAPEDLAEKLGLLQEPDPSRVEAWVAEVLRRHPSLAAEYRAGKEAVLNAVVGRVMEISGGRADPRRARETAERLLKGKGGGRA